LDAGVLIAAARGTGTIGTRALARIFHKKGQTTSKSLIE
jgi:hypothetical protein